VFYAGETLLKSANTNCSMPGCDKEPRRGQRYCKDCHGLYMRAWRAKRRREELLLRASVVKLRARIAELLDAERVS